jgi:hypothetical protein
VNAAFGQSTLLLRAGGIYALDLKKAGFLSGLEYGYNVDEMINVSVGAGYQRIGEKEVVRDDSAKSAGVTTYRISVKAQDLHYIFPLKAGLRVRLPLGGSVLPVISGGLGYVLYNHNANAKDTSNNQSVELVREGLHTGFYWETGLGVDWKLGSRSSLLLDAVYQSAEPANKSGYARNLKAIQFHMGLLLEL